MADFLREKYAAAPPEVIMAGGEEALDFWLRHRDEDLPGGADRARWRSRGVAGAGTAAATRRRRHPDRSRRGRDDRTGSALAPGGAPPGRRDRCQPLGPRVGTTPACADHRIRRPPGGRIPGRAADRRVAAAPARPACRRHRLHPGPLRRWQRSRLPAARGGQARRRRLGGTGLRVVLDPPSAPASSAAGRPATTPWGTAVPRSCWHCSTVRRRHRWRCRRSCRRRCTSTGDSCSAGASTRRRCPATPSCSSARPASGSPMAAGCSWPAWSCCCRPDSSPRSWSSAGAGGARRPRSCKASST